MKVTNLVLHGAERLSENERSFFVLAGQLCNDITLCHKLTMSAFREIDDPIIQQANSVLIVHFLKAWASNLWQGWKLIQEVFKGTRVSEAGWLRQNRKLIDHIRSMKRRFHDDCVFERIRNKFGYHYDVKPIGENATEALSEHGFAMLVSDRVINTFYVSSEVVTWSSILEARGEEEFEKAYTRLVHEVANASSDFLTLTNLIVEAFCTHVVNDLGGTLKAVEECEVQESIGSGEACFPVFLA